MAIQVNCTGCQAKLKAPDSAAGKRIKCPKCQTVVSVPAANGASAAGTNAVAAAATSPAKSEQWYLQTPDSSQYGPVSRGELDGWYSEGRVSSDCQLLKEGASQWQWAAEIYPALSQGAPANSSPAGSGQFASGASGGGLSPLSPLSSVSAFADPLASPAGLSGLSPLGAPSGSTAATLPSFTSGAAPAGLGNSGMNPLNPYNAPASVGTYGGYQTRRGPHPMVIVAGIFHIIMGLWNSLNCLLCSIGGIALLALGGAVGAAGAGNPDEGAQVATGALATFGVVGAVIAFILALLFLAYGVTQIVTAVGLFQRKSWARMATFMFASMGILASLFYLAAIVLMFDISSIIGLMGELIYVPILFIAMLLPDATSDFR